MNEKLSNTSNSRQSITSAAAGAGVDKSPALLEANLKIAAGEKLESNEPRYLGEDTVTSLYGEIRVFSSDLFEAYLRRHKDSDDIAENVLAMIERGSTFKGRTMWRDEVTRRSMLQNIRTFTENDKRLVIVMPAGGGKAPNPLKNGAVVTPDISDMTSWGLLEALGKALSEIYEPGALIVSLPDAHLHSADIGFPLEDTVLYMKTAAQDLERLAFDHVKLAPTDQLIPANFGARVDYWADQSAELATRQPEVLSSAREQVDSLVYSLNTRVFRWPLERSIEAYAAIAGVRTVSDRAEKDAALIRQCTEAAVWHYMGVNQTIRELDLPALAAKYYTGRPDYFRATVHAKPGEPRLLLTQSNKLARPALLPMHGLGMRYESNDRPRFASTFEIEALVNGYVPVLEERTGRFLHYQPSKI